MGCDDAYHAYGDNDAKMESGEDMGGQHAEMHTSNSNFPDHSDEDADHWMAECLGGVSRTAVKAGGGKPGVANGSGTGGSPLPALDIPNATDVLTRPVVYLEVTGDNSANYEFLNLANEEQVAIVREVLPDILNRFLTKNKDYEHFPEANLGPKAHFVGVWRKVGKLRKALWDGEPLEHEQISEVIDDLIGHLLLARLGLKGVD